MERLSKSITEFFINMGLSARVADTVEAVVLVILILFSLYLIYEVLRRLVQPTLLHFTRKTEAKWDDIVFRQKTMRWCWILIVVIIANWALPASLAHFAKLQEVASTAMRVALVLTMMMVVIEMVKSLFLLVADSDNVDEIARQMHDAQDRGEEFAYKPSHSLKGLQQMLSVIIVGVAVILVVSILVGKDPLLIFSGLGAAAAVLMLVFQDSILGVVAGVQLTANDMLQPGDWIAVPKYDANGIVQEVTLATVKIRNWDNTIITIPPYLLVREGFQNWRGMLLSKGRRVTRSLRIDMTTVRFATEAEVARWSAMPWWKATEGKERVVNLTAFRQALEHFLTTVPSLMHNMLFMVRELEPTAEGLPVEIYFFTSKIEWKQYEKVQSDVYDQVLAMLPEFGLSVFQHPTGADLRCLSTPRE